MPRALGSRWYLGSSFHDYLDNRWWACRYRNLARAVSAIERAFDLSRRSRPAPKRWSRSISSVTWGWQSAGRCLRRPSPGSFVKRSRTRRTRYSSSRSCAWSVYWYWLRLLDPPMRNHRRIGQIRSDPGILVQLGAKLVDDLLGRQFALLARFQPHVDARVREVRCRRLTLTAANHRRWDPVDDLAASKVRLHHLVVGGVLRALRICAGNLSGVLLGMNLWAPDGTDRRSPPACRCHHQVSEPMADHAAQRPGVADRASASNIRSEARYRKL